MNRYAVAVDLGGTNVRVAAVRAGGDILHRAKRPSRAREGVEAVVRSLLSAFKEVFAIIPPNRVAGVGIAVAGAIDLQAGLITQSPNFPGWNDVPLKEIVEKKLSLPIPVLLENDANAAALGERWQGAGAGSNNLVCLTLGTGIGGGVIVNGMLLHGADGMASELGHITIRPDGPPCSCGNTGCLESLCSATALRRTALERLRSGEQSLLVQQSGGSLEKVTAEMIAQAAQAGDTLSTAVYQEMGMNLGIGIASLINIFNPDTVILGGQVSKAWNLFFPAAQKEIARRALRVPGRRAAILPARCGDDAGLLGAAHLVFKTVNSER